MDLEWVVYLRARCIRGEHHVNTLAIVAGARPIATQYRMGYLITRSFKNTNAQK
jgi:hypothetical protein